MDKNKNNSFWNTIKDTIKFYHLYFLYDTIGGNYLSEDEITFLEKKLNKKLETQNISFLDKIFLFGQISQKIGLFNANQVKNKDFSNWLKEHKIESSEQLDKIKAQTYLDVLSKQFKIEKDLRQKFLNVQNNKEGFKLSKIVDFFKEKFEDWSSLKESISYTSESAFNEGKIKEILDLAKENNNNDPLVYKVPILDEKLCPYCRSLYLDSKGNPKLFRLSELEANGTNIGLKPSEWKATIESTHIHCRCLLQYFEELPNIKISDYIFDEEKHKYVLNKENTEDKIKSEVIIGDKKFEI